MEKANRIDERYKEQELKRLIRRISILSIAFVLACAGIQIYFSLLNKQIVADSNKEILDNTREQVEEIFNNVKLIASQFEYNTYLKNFLLETTEKSQINENEALKNIMKELASIKKDHAAISTVWIADFDADFFVKSNGHVSDDSWIYKDRPWYKKASKSKETYVTNPFISAADGNEVVSIMKPIFDENQQYLGIVALDIDFKYMEKCLSSIDVQAECQLRLISDDKTVVFNGGEETEGNVITTAVEISIPGWEMFVSMPYSTLMAEYEKKYVNFEVIVAMLIVVIFLMCIGFAVSKYFTDIKTKIISDIDEMTGIYNARGMTSAIEEVLRETDSNSYFYAALAVRKINILNEILGFSKVDNFFVHISNCLKNEIKKDECYGRISGNKFGLFFKAENSEIAKERLQKINDNIVRFRIEKNGNLSIKLIISALEIGDERDLEKIKSYTDFTLEMERSNSSYDNNIIFFNNNFKEMHAYEQHLENSMEGAVENDEFEVYIQGKYDVKTLELRGGEVLVRWNNAKSGLILPAVFIPLFEKNGFIIKLDYLVFEKTCKLLRKWIDAGVEPLQLAVNLSRAHLDHLEIVDKMCECIKKYDVPPSLLQVELTESALAENLGNLTKLIKLLKEKNISVAIDDFGSGYSTLSTLKDLDFDTLKIDREFFTDMHISEKGQAIVRSIISMANDLKIETVSEGIETKEQLNFLQENNGNLVQGFYFAKPVPIESFEKFMEKQRVKA